MTRRASLVFLSLLASAVVATPAAAQEPRAAEERKPVTIPADGTELFQYLLDSAKIKPIKANESWNVQNFDDVIVIILGDPTKFAGGQPAMHTAALALQRGGAVLVAADTPLNFMPFGSDMQIADASVHGEGKTQRGSLFLGKPNLPFVVPLEAPLKAGPEGTLFEGLNRIATNQTSSIRKSNAFVADPFETPLATFPADCRVDVFSRRTQFSKSWSTVDVNQREHYFAVGGSGQSANGQPYRCLAMADPSVFINQMMLARDDNGRTDNLELAIRTISYLSEENGQKVRSRCIFYQNGQIVESFGSLNSMMQPPLPMPNIRAMQEKLADFINQTIDKFQTNDVANKLTRGFPGLVTAILVLLGIRAGYYLLRSIFAARHSSQAGNILPPTPGGLPIVSKGERVATVFDRRQRELLRRNNLYEPVRVLIRDFFAEAGAPDGGRKLPKVRISDAVHRPDTLRAALGELWKIAHGPPRVVTVQRWSGLEPLFERVRQAQADGKWHFA